MPYLRLIQPSMQKLAETVASALDVEVAIADKNLTRIVGTGQFYTRLDEDCADDSLFAKVIEGGVPIVNLTREEYCKNCSHLEDCPEFANMSYPIKKDNEVCGVVSFASLDLDQADLMRLKKEEYFNMLKEVSMTIEREIYNLRITNKLKKNVVEADEIINCLNKGIIIINSNQKIIHVNLKALETLGISMSQQKIIEAPINNFIENIRLDQKDSGDIIDCWRVDNKDIRVIYNLNKIFLDNDEYSLMISFDVLTDIINLAKTYGGRRNIQFANIIGNSKPLLEAIKKSKIAANTDSTILLQGDSGTGKELFAQSIHNESQRKNGPFVAINCASIPENLIESELFGYEKGAFTGANLSGKKGKIELANNGTLFLDEIGDLPLYLQTRLLRVLQERSVDKLGGEKPVDVNIRIISATNKDLQDMVKEGSFRLDLYYRLNVIPIQLPRLRDREDDIFLCSEFIIDKLADRMNREKKKLSKELRSSFKEYSWPGNIRELENILEHGMCFAEDEYIRLGDLPDYLQEELKKADYPKDNVREIRDYLLESEEKSLDQLKIDFEKKVISELIEKHGDTVEGKKIVAHKLNIGLTTLYRKINDYKTN